MNKSVLPVGTSGNHILFVHSQDIAYIGDLTHGPQVQCIKVDLASGEIGEPGSLEVHLKFGSWSEIDTEREREEIVSEVMARLSEQSIQKLLSMPSLGINT